MRGYARREFQLTLLRRMADLQPDLVDAAREEMRASHMEYMAAFNRWQAMQFSRRAPSGMRLYRAVLGPAEDEHREAWGDLVVTVSHWPLPALWPDLRWQTYSDERGAVLNGWLVRAPGSPVPALPEPARLAPWSCVVGDVTARYPAARQAESDTPSRWLAEVVDGRGRSWRLTFVYGLLHTTGPVAD